MNAYFIFKGRNSDDMGIKIEEMPHIMKPKRRMEEVTIPGCHGTLFEDEGVYEDYELPFVCGMRGKERIEAVVEWLDGSGDLIVSTQPNRVYHATIQNAIPISDVVYLYNSFMIRFRVQPRKRSVNAENDKLTLTKGQTFWGKGQILANPTMTVYGEGDITLLINGVEYVLQGVADFITVNSEIAEVYKNKENQNNCLKGTDFPAFQTGENRISWTGNVEKIEIEPNWRWL